MVRVIKKVSQPEDRSHNGRILSNSLLRNSLLNHLPTDLRSKVVPTDKFPTALHRRNLRIVARERVSREKGGWRGTRETIGTQVIKEDFNKLNLELLLAMNARPKDRMVDKITEQRNTEIRVSSGPTRMLEKSSLILPSHKIRMFEAAIRIRGEDNVM